MNIQEKITASRRQLGQYISRQAPRAKWLNSLAITGGILGTAFAGIPAIGGKSAIAGLHTSWQLMCIGAAVFTLIATIANTLKSNSDIAGRLMKAQTCDAKLEILELLLSEGLIDNKQAIERYGEYMSDCVFLKG